MTMVKYRPDIDGLRAIAVLSVIAYHYFPGWFKGGFLGVDIFFVISGYLITAIITSDLNAEKFTFTNFYLRRIKRIVPSLIVVLVASLIFGWLWLLPEEFKVPRDLYLGEIIGQAAERSQDIETTSLRL
jgi:peptidoglycan/LPS O-acetylase OafA/YrhL